jgi:hypothetical protein
MARSSGKRDDLEHVLRVRPGTRVDLARIDPDETYGHSKDDAADELEDGLKRLADVQDRLWAEGAFWSCFRGSTQQARTGRFVT